MTIRYRKTVIACYIGFIVQAIDNNFMPLLFLILQSQYQIPLNQITMLITINFTLQMLIAGASALLVDWMGYRASAVMAHLCSATGLICLVLLPERMHSPFAGILISVVLYAIGGGVLEVIISPISESCPYSNKEYTMSLLHSFYSWGSAGVIILSTVFLAVFGSGTWKVLSLLWALLPIMNGIAFLQVPITPMIDEPHSNKPVKELLTEKPFWGLLILMICTGASEQTICQWASVFAEQGLGIPKVLGDIAGPALFVFCMGAARVTHSLFCKNTPLTTLMFYSSCLCILSYLMISITPYPFISLAGMACCGFSLGVMWPGIFSRAVVLIKQGGTAMFALLAFAGDLGCAAGPTFAGYIAESNGDNLRLGIACSIIFPLFLAFGTWHQRAKPRHIFDAKHTF